MWNFDENISLILKKFTGEILPNRYLSQDKLTCIKDERRLFLHELSKKEQNLLITFFENHKSLIVSDILRGRGSLSADWMLVTQNFDENNKGWAIQNMNKVCDFYAQGKVQLSPRGSLKIGKITMQRKGGTPDPTSLQFKINPLEVFNIQ